MSHNSQNIKRIFLILGDLALLYGALAISLAIRVFTDPEIYKPNLIYNHVIPFTIIFFLWVIFFGAFGLYDLRFMKNSRGFLYRLMKAMAANIVLAIVVFYLAPFFEIEPRRNLLLIASIGTLLIFIWRYLFNLLIIKTPFSKVLFWGINDTEVILIADFLLKNPQLGQKPVAFLLRDEKEQYRSLPLPTIIVRENLPHIIRDTGADTIVVSQEIKENKMLVTMLFEAIPLGVGVVEFSSFYESHMGKIPHSLIGEIWFLENLIGTRRRFYEFFKRFLDAVVALPAGIFLLIITPLVACAIKLESAGPIFFKQKRVGRNGEIFDLIKFRSMVQDAEQMSGFKGEGRDPRHTRVGTFLRKSYLDELSQIINIIKGEMSFVGPRPERPKYVAELKQKIPFYEMRLLVPPGITGWAQINMENDASVEDAPEKMQYDLYYIKNRSFGLDLLIILRTISILLHRQGR